MKPKSVCTFSHWKIIYILKTGFYIFTVKRSQSKFKRLSTISIGCVNHKYIPTNKCNHIWFYGKSNAERSNIYDLKLRPLKHFTLFLQVSCTVRLVHMYLCLTVRIEHVQRIHMNAHRIQCTTLTFCISDSIDSINTAFLPICNTHYNVLMYCSVTFKMMQV